MSAGPGARIEDRFVFCVSCDCGDSMRRALAADCSEREHMTSRPGHVRARVESRQWQRKLLGRIVCSCGWTSQWVAEQAYPAALSQFSVA
jgi:hypothetical protein